MLLLLCSLNLVLGASLLPFVGGRCDFNLIYGTISFSALLNAPMLLGLWVAMADSRKPWRLMIATLVAASIVLITMHPSVYLYDMSSHLFLLMLATSLPFLVLRFFGWTIANTRPVTGAFPDEHLISTPKPEVENHKHRLQYSLADMLVWTAAVALILGILSTLHMMQRIWAELDLIQLGCLALCACLVVAITLGRKLWVVVVLLLTLIVAVIVMAPLCGPNSLFLTVPVIVWTAIQLLFFRAAGYRFLRVANRPVSIEPSPRPCVSAR
jgi:hypothetical protein